MPRKRFTSEQIIGKLRKAEVELARGSTVGQVCKKLQTAEQTYYRGRAEYGGMRVERLWRREGLQVPQKQPQRGRLWFNDGSCTGTLNLALTRGVGSVTIDLICNHVIVNEITGSCAGDA